MFRQAVIDAYGELGGQKHLVAWGKKNPTEFYKIMARLIPSEVAVSGNQQHFVALLPEVSADSEEWGRKYAPLSDSHNPLN